jgi:hypothetical protein
MFCDQCGNPLQPDYNVCPKCGKALHAICGMPGQTRFQRHLHLLGLFWMIASAVWLIPSFVLLMMGGHALPFVIHDASPFNHVFFPGHVFFPPLMFGLGSGFLLIAAGGLCVGWGLMHREHWARTAAIVLGVLVLLHPPFGTLLGVFTLWVLLSNGAAAQYEDLTRTR